MAYNLCQTNTIYDIYGRTINGVEIYENGQPVPTIATAEQTDEGVNNTTAISPLLAHDFGYQSYYKAHGIFYGFSGLYSAISTNLNITNGSRWYTSQITELSLTSVRVSSLNKKSTYLITAFIQFSSTTPGQVLDLDIQNANTGGTDPIVRCGTFNNTSVAGISTYNSLLSGVVDVINNVVDITIKIIGINLNGGPNIPVQTNSHLTITEL